MAQALLRRQHAQACCTPTRTSRRESRCASAQSHVSSSFRLASVSSSRQPAAAGARDDEPQQPSSLAPSPPTGSSSSSLPHSFASYLHQHSQWQGARQEHCQGAAALLPSLAGLPEVSSAPHLRSLPPGTSELLADALLILRAARTDASLDAR